LFIFCLSFFFLFLKSNANSKNARSEWRQVLQASVG
jgi:hypothetical protein